MDQFPAESVIHIGMNKILQDANIKLRNQTDGVTIKARLWNFALNKAFGLHSCCVTLTTMQSLALMMAETVALRRKILIKPD